MHFVFQFMIFESNIALFKAAGWGVQSGKGMELNTKKNQDCHITKALPPEYYL